MKTGNMKFAFAHLGLAVILVPALFLNACKKEKSDATLAKDFRNMDSFLRSDSYQYDSMNFCIAKIAGNFVHWQKKELSLDERKATVEYRWNSDSS